MIDSKYRGYGYGTLLFISAWDSFSKGKWIRGVSAKYETSNPASCKLHEKAGFKVIKKYFDENREEEKVYAVRELHEGK
jgi:L-amino acid N-acyltransferase YncA